MARTLIDMVVETDVRDLLPEHPRADAGAPPRGGVHPGRVRALPGRAHSGCAARRAARRRTTSPSYGDADGYAEEIEEFLTGARHAPRARSRARDRDVHRHRRLHERAAALGDRALARAAGPPRRARARRARAPPRPRGQDDGRRLPGHLRRPRARGSAARARSRDEVRALDIELRAGLHTGECELDRRRHRRHRRQHRRADRRARRRRTRCSSRAPSRTSSSARASRSRTAATKTLKGVPGEWRLFAVDGVEAPASSRLVPDTRERGFLSRTPKRAPVEPRRTADVAGSGHSERNP